MKTTTQPGSTIFLEGAVPVQFAGQPPYFPQSVIFVKAHPTEDKVKMEVRMGHLPCTMEVDPETFSELPVVKGENLDFQL